MLKLSCVDVTTRIEPASVDGYAWQIVAVVSAAVDANSTSTKSTTDSGVATVSEPAAVVAA